MTNVPLAQDGVSIVVGGIFNPAIFSPDWLLREDLIDGSTYTSMTETVLTPDFTSLRVGDIAIQVTREAFQVATSNADEFERARDLAVGILRLLSHTPIAVLGINRHFHIKADSDVIWHAIGDAIVPKAAWASVLNLPGMRSAVLWGARPDNHAGRVQVQIEPSVAIPNGIFVSQNDHYDLYDVVERPSARTQFPLPGELNSQKPTADKISVAVTMLETKWADSMSRADDVVETVWTLRQEHPNDSR